MMSDIIMIVLISVLFNHLGLCQAIENVIKHKIIVLNCSKCLSFWSVFLYSLYFTSYGVILSLFIAFISAYCALWIELMFGLIDNYYTKLWQKLK